MYDTRVYIYLSLIFLIYYARRHQVERKIENRRNESEYAIWKKRKTLKTKTVTGEAADGCGVHS